MENLVLVAASNHASFLTSTWSAWASAPHDLLLVTEDGFVGAHCGILLPLSVYCSSILKAPSFAGPIQVVLAGISSKAVTAVKDLIYSGTCNLSELKLPEILETLAVLGIEVSGKSFSFQTKSTDDDASNRTSSEFQDFGDVEEAHSAGNYVYENVKKDLGGTEADGAMTKEESGEVVGVFEGITVGKAFHHVESSLLSTSFKVNWQNTGKINKDVQVKIPKLKMGEKLSLHMKENTRCSQCLKKFRRADAMKRHIKNVHTKDQPYQCNKCMRKFGKSANLTRHIEVVHNKETPHACPQPGCAQKFGLKLDLKRHMMKVHDFEKSHPCVEQNCDEKFLQLRDLKDHLRRAHGAAELVCGIQNCAATFTFRSSLFRHKRKYHSDK